MNDISLAGVGQPDRNFPVADLEYPPHQFRDVLGWLALAGLVFFIAFQAITSRRAKKAAVMQAAEQKEK